MSLVTWPGGQRKTPNNSADMNVDITAELKAVRSCVKWRISMLVVAVLRYNSEAPSRERDDE